MINTMEKTPRPTNTIPECKAGSGTAPSNSRSSIASRQPYNKNKARISDTYQITQPIESANRYTMLANLPETTICYDGYVTPKIMEVTQTSTNNYMKKEHGRIKYPSVI
jgi:hypothetical protein